MSHTLLLIEDDQALSQTLSYMLNKKGFKVEVAHDAFTGLQKGFNLKPDAIILDIMLPDMDGWQICSRFREMSDVPIIMLTALASEQDRLKGLSLGANDYLVKPVAIEELTARLKALLKPGAVQANKPGDSGIFIGAGLTIDFGKQEVSVEDNSLNLSPPEFRLLAELARHKGQTLAYKFLLTAVWGPEYADEMDYLRLYISYLRRKIGKFTSKSDIIQHISDVGYRFNE